MKIGYILPAVIFTALCGFFAWRLVLIERGDMPKDIPSVMINRPAPEFDLPPLLTDKPGLKTADLKGRVTIISFFASWCSQCLVEHRLFGELAGKGAVLVGIDYKDKPENGREWLQKQGDNFAAVAMDGDGRTAIDFGLYGVPESYVIDKDGIIRYKQTGPLTSEIIAGTILPLIKELNK